MRDINKEYNEERKTHFVSTHHIEEVTYTDGTTGDQAHSLVLEVGTVDDGRVITLTEHDDTGTPYTQTMFLTHEQLRSLFHVIDFTFEFGGNYV